MAPPADEPDSGGGDPDRAHADLHVPRARHRLVALAHVRARAAARARRALPPPRRRRLLAAATHSGMRS